MLTIGRYDETYDEDYVLYKPIENDDARVRVWRIVRSGNGHKTFSGIHPHGAVQETLYTYSSGKNVGRLNATTGSEQSSLAVKAKIKAKLQSGFKSDGTLPVFDVAVDTTWKQPTLAQKWRDKSHKMRYPAYLSPKLDGVRCVTKKDGMWSRTGKRYITCPHIWKAVKYLFDLYPDLILDGELYFHTDNKDNFDEIISLVKKKKPTPADIKAAEVVQYWVFDVVPPTDSYTMPFSERYKYYFNDLLHKDKIDHKIVRPVYQRQLMSPDSVMPMSDKLIDEGFEGGMIRAHDAVYEWNKRIDGLQKDKRFVDDEFRIVDVIEGEGNLVGMVGKFIMETLPQHKTPSGKPERFKAAPTGSHALWAKWWKERKKMIGMIGTIKYQNLTPRGVPRFGRLKCVRDD